MAPSQVFSYFRNNHRKQIPTPTSPSPSNQIRASFSPQYETLPPPPLPPPPPSSNLSAVDSPTSASPISPLPPTLPSIRRVSSYRYKQDQHRSQHPVPVAESLLNNAPRQELEDAKHLSPSESGPNSEQRYDQEAGSSATVSRPPQAYSSNAQPGDNKGHGQREIPRRPITSVGQGAYTVQQTRNYPPPPMSYSPASTNTSLPISTSATNLATDVSSNPARSAPAPPSGQPKPAKSKINLLNPVSLLMRRRTAQTDQGPSEKIPLFSQMDVPAMNLPKDYDPRIRGKVVHDFSAPRPKKNQSTTDLNESTSNDSQDGARRISSAGQVTDADKTAPHDSGKSPEKEHTPVFTEHFDDDVDVQGHTAAVHRESLANPAFLARMSRHLDQDTQVQDVLQAHTRRMSDNQPNQQQQQQQQSTAPSTAGERTSRGTDVPSYRASSDQSTARSSFSNDTRATSPPLSPSLQPTSRTSMNLDLPFQSSGLPSHLPSNASRTSRFSFQLNSDRSAAQEKALEEKHKQKHPPKPIKSESIVESVYEETDEDDMSDFDMDDGGFEEQIPGVNADAGDEEFHGFGRGLRDTYSEPPFEDSPVDEPQQVPGRHDTDAIDENAPDNGFHADNNNVHPLHRGNTEISIYSDDMYFDDGLIEEPISAESNTFDESMLDSMQKSTREYPSVETTLHRETTLEDDLFNHDPIESMAARATNQDGPSDIASDDLQSSAGQAIPVGFDFSQSNMKPYRLSIPSNNDTDEYQTALASAAMKAEAAGKFRRKSIDDSSSIDAEFDIHATRLPGDDLPGAYYADDEQQSWAWNDEDIDDDPMVAAANAEALAADESGFYGREFGFYGNGANGDEAWNGGFFGAAGNELYRSKSGKNASQEPNLTPITERSEFSTRNSFISLSAVGGPYGGSNVSIPLGSREQQSGPGLKELAATSTFDDDELTLSQLMKLRKEAFGGRSASAGASASSSPSTTFSSPLAMNTYASIVPPETETVVEEAEPVGLYTYDNTHQRATSHGEPLTAGSQSTAAFSPDTTPRPPRVINQTYEDSKPPVPFNIAASAGSPQRPLAHPSSSPPMHVPMPSQDLVQKFATRPPASSESFAQRQAQAQLHQQQQQASKHRHQRNSHGGSDSVTYVREEDEGGETQWFLERRRRMSTGEVVVVGRELVEGGRI